jgi:hypothetical protein
MAPALAMLEGLAEQRNGDTSSCNICSALMELERKNPNRNQNRNPDLELVLRDALAMEQ